jgi:DNA-binding response OmpR family regulator
MTTTDAPCTVSDDDACDVLIVEDDPLQAEELAGFLRRARLKVEIYHDGSTGLHRAAVAHPRVAILDYNLPALDGGQVAERIRSVSPHTAVIMISGRIGRPPETVLARVGIYAFRSKPLALAPLRSLVGKLIRMTRRDGIAPVMPPHGLFSFLL